MAQQTHLAANRHSNAAVRDCAVRRQCRLETGWNGGSARFAALCQTGARRFERRHDQGQVSPGAGRRGRRSGALRLNRIGRKSIEGGGEYTVSIAGTLELPVIRIVPAGEFYDYHAKYIANDTQY